MSIVKQTEAKVIMCVFPKNIAKTVLHALFEKGITRANLSFARGFDIHDQPTKTGGIPHQEEKEILTVTAENSQQADELFQFIYEKAEMDHLGGGILFIMDLKFANPYVLPQDQA